MYDILEDLWSTLANVTYGQLFQNSEYKVQIVKVFKKKIKPVQALTSKQQRLIQLLKVYIRIAGILLSTLINIRASIYIISEDLVKKLKLKIEANNETKVAPLEEWSKVKIIGLILNAPIAVQNLRILESLYVMEGTESVIILKTDWMDWYQADIRKSDNVMKVWVNDEKARIRL